MNISEFKQSHKISKSLNPELHMYDKDMYTLKEMINNKLCTYCFHKNKHNFLYDDNLLAWFRKNRNK
jgi:hypothetical protein